MRAEASPEDLKTNTRHSEREWDRAGRNIIGHVRNNRVLNNLKNIRPEQFASFKVMEVPADSCTQEVFWLPVDASQVHDTILYSIRRSLPEISQCSFSGNGIFAGPATR